MSISGNAAASQEVTYYVCATDTVNIRSGAGTGYDKVGKMPSGAIADLVDDSVEGWYQVSYNGVTGYVSADYSKLTDSATLSLGEQIVACLLYTSQPWHLHQPAPHRQCGRPGG